MTSFRDNCAVVLSAPTAPWGSYVVIEIEFFGVRGSTPCSCPTTAGIGGNTSCVTIRVDDETPIICDLGTGLRYLGCRLDEDRVRLNGSAVPFEGTALVTHLHWDHVQGLPFFLPLLRAGAQLTVVAPEQDEGTTLADAIGAFVSPPLFPVDLSELPGSIEFHETSSGSFDVGSATVTCTSVTHCGPTNAYRIEANGTSVVYISDHQQPADQPTFVPDSVLELCRDADVLIHDAQYDAEEFETRATWGHSTYDYAAEVARQSGVRTLVLFHHDPTHGDDWVANAVVEAQKTAGPDVEVVAASEGLTMSVEATVRV